MSSVNTPHNRTGQSVGCMYLKNNYSLPTRLEFRTQPMQPDRGNLFHDKVGCDKSMLEKEMGIECCARKAANLSHFRLVDNHHKNVSRSSRIFYLHYTLYFYHKHIFTIKFRYYLFSYPF